MCSPCCNDDRIYTEKVINHKFIWHQWTTRKWIHCVKKCVLIFIPWKHKEKELVRVEYDDLLESIDGFVKDWVRIDSYVSISDEDDYHDEVIIKNFYGLHFIYNYTNFLCDFKLQNVDTCLKILYKEQHDLMNLQFDEEVHAMN